MYLGRDKQAQMHVVDAVAAASILIFVMVVINQLSAVPSVVTPQTTYQLKAWADDALRNLDSQDASDYGFPDMSLLEYYLSRHAVDEDRTHCPVLDGKISNYFPSYLPKSYNLYYDDSSNDNKVVWLPEGGDGGEPETITIDDISFSSASNTNTISWPHTVGAEDNRILVACSGTEDTSVGDWVITSATYNGKAMTKAESISGTTDGTTYQSSEIWYVLSPDTGAHDITFNYAGTVSCFGVGAISFFNAKQQAPEKTASNAELSNPVDITTPITTLSDGALVIDTVSCGNDV